MKKNLEADREDAKRSSLRKRCNKLTNTLLCKVDKELSKHLQDQSFQPELAFLCWLRILYSRQFSIPSVLVAWDYFFADIDYQLVAQRKYEEYEFVGNFYQREDYF